MQVFLIPLGPGRYEPYTELGDGPVALEGREPPRGAFRRFWTGFTEMMQAADRAQRERDMADGERSLGGRLTDRVLAWVAERIAEQRLLWHLRRHDAAVLVYPSDLAEPQAQDILRSHLRREAERHRRWLLIDGALTLVTGPLFFFVPGPNLIAYYFAFRAVGHYLSGRGARHGLRTVVWSARSSDQLAELGRLVALEPAAWETRIRAVAADLQLPQLPNFLRRMALRGA
jgi:hypothetical protein